LDEMRWLGSKESTKKKSKSKEMRVGDRQGNGWTKDSFFPLCATFIHTRDEN